MKKEEILEQLKENPEAAAAIGALYDNVDKSTVENEALKTANGKFREKLGSTTETLKTVKEQLQSAGYDGESDLTEFFSKKAKAEPKVEPPEPPEQIRGKEKIESAFYELKDLAKQQAEQLKKQTEDFTKLKTELDNAKADKEKAKNYKEFKKLFLDEKGESDFALLDEYLPKYANQLSRDGAGKLILKHSSGEEIFTKTAAEWAEELRLQFAPGKKSKQVPGAGVKPVSNLDIKTNAEFTSEYIANRKKELNIGRNKSGL